MSMEQNEAQVSQGHQGPPAGATSSPTEGAQTSKGQQRRRRRRRKTGRPALAPEGQAAPVESTPEAVRTQPQEQPAGKPYRDQNRSQERDQRPAQASGEGFAPDQRGRQGRNYQHHGKKQQRQAKGGSGGSNQGRQFQKAGPPPQPRESNPGNGIQPSGEGGYRKNKVRRAAPSFVGPMDHSYRMVNGNVADSSPSTMDYRSNGSNGNGNGNVYARNSYIDPAEAAAPVLLRDDAPVRIICFIEDLFIVAKMQETARKIGVKVSFAKAEKETVTRLLDTPEAERPSLIVFDLNNANAKPLTLIPKLKAKLKRATSVIGFLSHIQGDLKVKAIEAGCDMVMPKSAFSQNLPNLLRRHGLDEELEAVEV